MDETSPSVCLNLPYSDARLFFRLFRLVLETHDGRNRGADSEEKRDHASDIDASLRVAPSKRDADTLQRDLAVHLRASLRAVRAPAKSEVATRLADYGCRCGVELTLGGSIG